MNTEKNAAKIKGILVVLIALVMIALFAVMIVVLKSCQEDLSTQGETSQTFPDEADPSDPVETSEATETVDPTETAQVEETTEDTDPTKPADSAGSRPAGSTGSKPAGSSETQSTTEGEPQEEVDRDPVIYIWPVTIEKGTREVTVNIRIRNNPGILGAVLKVSVDNKVFALARAEKSGYPGLTLTSPGPAAAASPYTFVLDAVELSADDKKDGTLFTITFNIKDTTAVGTYQVTLSYDTGAIFDENYKDPKIGLENGTITIR